MDYSSRFTPVGKNSGRSVNSPIVLRSSPKLQDLKSSPVGLGSSPNMASSPNISNVNATSSPNLQGLNISGDVIQDSIRDQIQDETGDVIQDVIKNVGLIEQSQKQGTNDVSLIGPIPSKIQQISLRKNINMTPFGREIKQLNSPTNPDKEQILENLERSILLRRIECSDEIVNDLKVKTFQLNMIDQFQERILFDHNHQDTMGCFVDAIVADENLLERNRFFRWITGTKEISSGSEGKVLRVYGDSLPMYAIKVPNHQYQDTLAHEAIVGMGALNKIRDKVPNFMHTYGAFMCSMPIFDENGKIFSMCATKENPVTYLVVENIQNGIQLHEVIKTLSESEFLQVYLQILNALSVAYKDFDFTHYDLHSSNVMIQVLPYYISIPLYFPNGDVGYIKTKHLARIIDYGFSHVYLENVHFGKYGLEQYGINPTSSFPMHDAYKLLLYCAVGAKEEVFNSIDKIYSFFGGNVRERISKRTPDDFFVAPNVFKNASHDDLIRYIIDRFPVDFIYLESPIDTTKSICEDSCIDYRNFIQFMFSENRLPKTLEDYCEAHLAIDKIEDLQHKTDLRAWVYQFNIDYAYNLEKEKELKQAERIAKGMKVLKIPSVIEDENFTERFYDKQLKQLLKGKTFIDNLKFWLTCVIYSYNKIDRLDNVIEDVNEFKKILGEAVDKFEELKQVVTENRRKNRVANIYNNDHIVVMEDIILARQVKNTIV